MQKNQWNIIVLNSSPIFCLFQLSSVSYLIDVRLVSGVQAFSSPPELKLLGLSRHYFKAISCLVEVLWIHPVARFALPPTFLFPFFPNFRGNSFPREAQLLFPPPFLCWPASARSSLLMQPCAEQQHFSYELMSYV